MDLVLAALNKACDGSSSPLSAPWTRLKGQ